MNIDFTGKTAIVTGAAGGIGYACAKALLESGAKAAAVERAGLGVRVNCVAPGGASVVGY